jgi:hypothetical protein
VTINRRDNLGEIYIYIYIYMLYPDNRHIYLFGISFSLFSALNHWTLATT